MSVVIKANNVTKRYKNCVALNSMSFDIQKGQILGLVGPNGAGKTTLLRSLVGLNTCEGDLEVLGLTPLAQRRQLMERLMFIADMATLPKWLKVWQAIEFVERVHPRFSRQKAEAFLAKTKIDINQTVKTLSKGMVTQLHLALIMAVDADVLILDEPTIGLDIIYRHEFYQSLLNDYFNEERTIIISTHQVEEIESILTHIMMINDGEIVLHDSMDAFTQRYCRLLVSPDKVQAAEQFNPIAQNELFGKKQFIFEDQDPKALSQLGALESVSVADVFLAKMKGAQS